MTRLKLLFGLLVLCSGLLLLNWRVACAAAGADLIIESVTFTPENPDVGEEVDIRVVVKNVGDANSEGFIRAFLYVDPADEPPVTDTAHTLTSGYGLQLPPGGSFAFTRTGHTFDTAGIHPVYAWVDRDDAVSEADETNNLSGPHDLQVGQVAGDQYEPDNNCAEATVLEMNGATQTHDLNPVGDEDWVQFVVESGVRYQFEVEAVGVDADISADIHPHCTVEPSFGGGTLQEFTAWTDGIYYARIYHNQADYGADTTYRVRVSAATSCNARYEPNNNCHLAGVIHANAGAQNHDFCQAADIDWIALDITVGYSYTVVAENLGSAANAQLELYAECTDPPPLGSASVLEFSAPYTGRVYLRTFNNEPDLHGPTTNYRLEVNENAGCSADIYEQDDSAETAALITVDAPAQKHNICPANDPDWVEFSAGANTIYTIETLGLADSADTHICLYDDVGNELQCNDDDGEGRASRIVFVPTESGVYRVRVVDRDGELAGESSKYELQITSSRCTLDQFEPDGELADAQPITVNGSAAQHTFCAIADHDWHVFTANSGDHVIETFNLGRESDTVLKLYDANGTFLMQNNDANGTVASQIGVPLNAGTYYIEVIHNDPSRYGTGTEYTLHVRTGQPTPPPPTPTPPPPTPTPPPPPQSQIQTLIVVNETRMANKYGSAETTQMMSQLAALAAHENVKGEIMRIDQNSAIAAAYTDWDGKTGMDNVREANQTATIIRNVIQQYAVEHVNLRYLVLVGDDRMLPFYRVADEKLTDYPESSYSTQAGGDHPTAIALAHDFFLTDDFYGDANPVSVNGRQLFIPDLATGRLIESPPEIAAFITTYLANPTVAADSVSVTGYDFVTDSAQENCADWQSAVANVNCTLIGGGWSLSNYDILQTETDPPYRVRSINGHAAHYAEGSADFRNLSAAEILASYAADGGLVYTPGCHAGLNVPPTNQSANPNDNYATDLPQAYLGLGYNYIGNTGYGWGTRFGSGLSEALTRLYTQNLLDPTIDDVGTAFVRAKQTYYRRQVAFTPLDEKVLQQWTFYGLPMFQLEIGGQRTPAADEFPSADFGGNFAFPGVTTFVAQLDLTAPPTQQDEGEGTFFELDGRTQTVIGQPVQPLFYADVPSPNSRQSVSQTLRGVALLGGEFVTQENFDPVVAVSTNDFFTDTTEPILTDQGWQPALPVSIAQQNGESEFKAVLGQFNAASQQQRLYDNVTVALYYSNSDDVTAPTINSVSGLYDSTTNEITVKVNAADASGIHNIVVAYTDGNSWQFKNLVYRADSQNWTNTFMGTATTRYVVQVVDNEGNVSVETNKGNYLAVTDVCGVDFGRCNIPLAIDLQTHTVQSRHSASMLIFLSLSGALLSWKIWTTRQSDRKEAFA